MSITPTAIANIVTLSLLQIVQASLQWDSWNRPPPDLPQQLRAEKEQEKMMEDPNFSAHLPGLMMAGSAERPDYELPQELREKYKRMAEVKRMAANEIRKGEIGEALAEEVHYTSFVRMITTCSGY